MYRQKLEKDGELDEILLIKKYLYNESTLANSKKPLLWLHINFDVNARWWSNFNSRNSTCLNQPYLYLTIKSIIDKCANDFQIVIINDETFEKILPTWNIKLNNLPDPLRSHLRELAYMKVLHRYGGLCIPPSFICFQSFDSIFKTSLQICDVFIGELVCKSVLNEDVSFFPSNQIIGCKKESAVMENYIKYLEKQVSDDYTNEMEFNKPNDQWLYNQILQKNVVVLDGKLFGIKNSNNEIIGIEKLMGDSDCEISNGAIGVYVPSKEILQRTKYQWFARMDVKQVLESNTMIGRYLLLSNN
tara:strand:- start:3335 stop:4240 length:906 start_codon:yes stop_codon:yes gene_type:complete